jgi:Zn ribbon nucleic-acid-binding protein
MVVTCTQCGHQLQAPDSAVGRQGRCPKCRSTFTIQAPTFAAPASPPPAPATAGPPPITPDIAGCPACRAALQPGAVLCVNCGYDLRIGDRRGTHVAQQPAPQPQQQSGGFFGPEKKALGYGMLGGLLLMVIAAVWFVAGLAGDIIFFYPPVLFVIGLVGFLKGLFTGNVSGRR